MEVGKDKMPTKKETTKDTSKDSEKPENEDRKPKEKNVKETEIKR